MPVDPPPLYERLLPEEVPSAEDSHFYVNVLESPGGQGGSDGPAPENVLPRGCEGDPGWVRPPSLQDGAVARDHKV